MDKPIYLAGPMTGIPQFNYPAFDAAAEDLRENHCLDIRSPAEMDEEDTRKVVMASPDGDLGEGIATESGVRTWGDFLAHDVKMLADELDGIILLEGWQNSKGARLECFVAMSCGYDLQAYHEGMLYEVTYTYALAQINMALMEGRERQLAEEAA